MPLHRYSQWFGCKDYGTCKHVIWKIKHIWQVSTTKPNLSYQSCALHLQSWKKIIGTSKAIHNNYFPCLSLKYKMGHYTVQLNAEVCFYHNPSPPSSMLADLARLLTTQCGPTLRWRRGVTFLLKSDKVC